MGDNEVDNALMWSAPGMLEYMVLHKNQLSSQLAVLIFNMW